MAGEGDKFAGSVKEKVGSVTGNDRLEGEGKGQKNAGKVESAVQGAKDKVSGAAEAVKDKLSSDDDHKRN
ncbi:MAG: CsbD family protein [Solirubrobacteraceae bacterium]|nr:CsbD family protein [Solirubrobacteraceae bacterium]